MTNNNIEKQKAHSLSRNERIFLGIVALLPSVFYITSVLGWFGAFYLMMSGKLGQEATDFGHSLNIFDHIIRTLQVLLIFTASLALILMRRLAVQLFLLSLLISTGTFIIALFGYGKWAISFLGIPSGILILVTIYLYIRWLNKRGYFFK